VLAPSAEPTECLRLRIVLWLANAYGRNPGWVAFTSGSTRYRTLFRAQDMTHPRGDHVHSLATAWPCHRSEAGSRRRWTTVTAFAKQSPASLIKPHRHGPPHRSTICSGVPERNVGWIYDARLRWVLGSVALVVTHSSGAAMRVATASETACWRNPLRSKCCSSSLS
jgi:hypothetical protein